MGKAALGLPTDDTQLAFFTVESLLRQGRLDPADLASSFSRERIYGVGRTVRAFVRAHRDEGKPWWQAGQPSAGNGALMRIAPVILPWLWGVSKQPWVDTVVATVVTHRDEAAVAASAGFVGLLCELLGGGRESPVLGGPEGGSGLPAVSDPRWWPPTFLRYARTVETGAVYRPRSPFVSFAGALCDFVEQFVAPAVEAEKSPGEASQEWHSGAYLLETVPLVLLILALYGSDPQEALIRAVNDTYDNDTIAAIVGAAVGGPCYIG